ncbi:MAG: hypothetical protein M1292_00785 [Bacteroidetes bacterium]|nr:hypothetical protein [Bacteroidota bacterium]
MKTKNFLKHFIFLIALFTIFSSCSKTTLDDTTSYQIIGQTYSGYSFTSTFDGHKMYVGYRFTSDTKSTRLLLDENTRIITQTEVTYSGKYPNFKIGGFDGAFISNDVLQIEGILMKKW